MPFHLYHSAWLADRDTITNRLLAYSNNPERKCRLCLADVRGGEMNAWQTNPKGRLRGGYRNMCFLGRGTHITRDMCSLGGWTHITRDMCSLGGWTNITRDTCFLGRKTHITRDTCFPGGGTHITKDMCFLGKGKNVAGDGASCRCILTTLIKIIPSHSS